MIDEIFEMIMKEARSRPGNNLKLNAFCVISDLNERVFHTVDSPDEEERRESDDR